MTSDSSPFVVTLATILESGFDSQAADLVAMLGGWELMAAEAPSLVDSNLLPPLIHIVGTVVQSNNGIDGPATLAISSLAQTAVRATSPSAFSDCLEVFLGSPAMLPSAAAELTAGLEGVIRAAYAVDGLDDREARRSADALEGLTRLALGGFVSRFELLGHLERFRRPAPSTLAISIMRSIGSAIDQWPEASSLADVVRIQAGAIAGDGPPAEGWDASRVESDAAWILATIAMVEALRADERGVVAARLDAAFAFLTEGADRHERDDAAVLVRVVTLVRALLSPGGARGETLIATVCTPDWMAELRADIQTVTIGSTGLEHWYGDRKQDALVAWAHLAQDLDGMRDTFERESLYQADVVINDLLEIYLGSRTYSVTRRVSDDRALLDVIQPVVEAGFAATAGLMRNLADHVDELTRRVGEEGSEDLVRQLGAAEQVLSAARQCREDAASGKGSGGPGTDPVPPLLGKLFPSGTPASLQGIDSGDLDRLVEALEANRPPAAGLSLMETGIVNQMRSALASGPDYVEERAAAVDAVLVQVVRFLAIRSNGQESTYPYLFDPSAKEAALHADLLGYLKTGPLAQMADPEVVDVGGGRVDIRIKFDGFSVYLEIKANDTKVALSDKDAYLEQAAAYQATDIRIGFVVALRHKSLQMWGAQPHITLLVNHMLVDIDTGVVGEVDTRSLILIDVPGGRRAPSSMR